MSAAATTTTTAANAKPAEVPAASAPENAPAQTNPSEQSQADKPTDGVETSAQQSTDATTGETSTNNKPKPAKKRNTLRKFRTRPASIKAAEEKRRLYVSGVSFKVPFKVMKENVSSFFASHGVEVEHVDIPKGRKWNYVFVDVTTAEGAQNAINIENPKLGERNLKINMSRVPSPSNKENKEDTSGETKSRGEEPKQETQQEEKKEDNTPAPLGDSTNGQNTQGSPSQTGKGAKKLRPRRKSKQIRPDAVLSPVTIMVQNLPFSITEEEELKKVFEQWSPVKASVPLRIYRGKKPIARPPASRGYGFITFEDEQRRDEAIQAMNGKTIGERTVNVKVAFENQGKQAAQAGDQEDQENQPPSVPKDAAPEATATTNEGANSAQASA